MSNMEKIFLGSLFVALLALVIFDGKRNAGAPPGYMPEAIGNDPVGLSTTADASGPAYLVANRPWMMPPPLNIMLPSKTVAPATDTPLSAYNCGSC